MSTSDPLRLYTYQELAAAWKLSPRTIQRWVSEDERRGIRVPRVRRRLTRHGYLVVMRAEVAASLLARHVPGL